MRRLARMVVSLTEGMKHHLIMLLAVVLLFGCTDENVVAPDLQLPIDTATVKPKAAVHPAGPQAVEGEIGPGAKYGLYLPEDWNGDLVLYAPGACAAEFGCREGELPAHESGFRDALLALGYAVAWTSYSETRFPVKVGVTNVRQLKALFTSRFGKPEHTYLYGLSMGGAVVMQLAESNPELFDGALIDSGLTGGVPFHMDYYLNCRVLFDYFFPGILPERLIPLSEYVGVVFPQMLAAMQAKPSAVLEMAGVDQIEMQFANPAELMQTIMEGVGWHLWDKFSGGIMAQTHDRLFFDNDEVYYTGSTDDVALNAGVQRFAAHPDTRNMLRQWWDPTGNLKIPVLTLHARRDPTVPVMHETAYAALVADAGASDMLVQRIVDMFGHAAFDVATRVAAVQDLDAWVTTGVRPTP